MPQKCFAFILSTVNHHAAEALKMLASIHRAGLLGCRVESSVIFEGIIQAEVNDWIATVDILEMRLMINEARST